jgi:hypothetical protein
MVGAGIAPSYPVHAYSATGSTAVRAQIGSAYIDLYPHSSWNHIMGSSSRFYFNKEIQVDTGLIGSYNEDLQLRTQGTTRLTLSNSTGTATFGGNVSMTASNVALTLISTQDASAPLHNVINLYSGKTGTAGDKCYGRIEAYSGGPSSTWIERGYIRFQADTDGSLWRPPCDIVFGRSQGQQVQGGGNNYNTIEAMRICGYYGTSSRVSINVGSQPSYELDVSGNIGYSGTITDYSLRELKENIVELDGTGFIEKFKKIPLYKYDLKPEYMGAPETTTLHGKNKGRYGLIADDDILYEEFPELVNWAGDDEDTIKKMGIDTTAYVGMLHGVIKELVTRIEALENAE